MAGRVHESRVSAGGIGGESHVLSTDIKAQRGLAEAERELGLRPDS